MSFGVLVGILQDDAQRSRASSSGHFHLTPLMDEKDNRWQNRSKKDHDNI